MTSKGNVKNLKRLTSEEARENGRKGGIASGKARKEKKVIRQVIEERLGDKDLNEIVDNLIQRAKENAKDFEALQASLGQKPIERVITSDIDENTLNEVSEMVAHMEKMKREDK